MDSFIEDDYLLLNKIKRVKSSRKKKKNKNRKKNEAKDWEESQTEEPSFYISSSSDHNSTNINGKKKRRKNKSKSPQKDSFALQQKKAAPPQKKCKMSHEVVGIGKADTPIKAQGLVDMNKHVPWSAKSVQQSFGKVRPKKRVLFDLSPKGSVVKTYHDVPQFCTETPFVDADEKHGTYTPTLQSVQHSEESLRGPEGQDSQDLFITQNAFLSPSLFQVPSDDEFTSTPDLKQTKSRQPSPQELLATVASKSTATQTENFFTSSQNSTFLTFHLKLAKCSDQPVDLSLPHRQRNQRSTALMKEEGDLHQRGKMDHTQINFVQMRLNESFFFKMKGETESPKSQCPLKKLGRGNKK